MIRHRNAIPLLLLRPLLLLQVYAKTFSVESKERSCQDWSWVHKHGFICFNVSVDSLIIQGIGATALLKRQQLHLPWQSVVVAKGELCRWRFPDFVRRAPLLRPRRSRLILTRCSPGLRPAGDLTESMRQETRKGYEGIKYVKYVHLIFISYSFIKFDRYLMEVIGNWWSSCSTFCSTLPNSMALDFVR